MGRNKKSTTKNRWHKMANVNENETKMNVNETGSLTGVDTKL